MKAKGKKPDRRYRSKENRDLVNAFIQAGDPTKKLLVMGRPNKNGDPDVIRDFIILTCDSDTDVQKSLDDFLNKFGVPQGKGPKFYEFMDSQIKGIQLKSYTSKGGGVPKRRELISLAAMEAYKQAKNKSPRGQWRYLKNKGSLKIGDGEVRLIEDNDGKERLYQMDGDRKEKSISYETFRQRYAIQKKIDQ